MTTAVEEILDPKHYFLVLFEFVDLYSPTTIQASIWQVDPTSPGFAYCMVDYYKNIRAKSRSKAPFNLWPYQLKFDIMKPLLIYRSLIYEDDSIETILFPHRDEPKVHPPKPLQKYSRSRNLGITPRWRTILSYATATSLVASIVTSSYSAGLK
jgi:hypothetical protein